MAVGVVHTSEVLDPKKSTPRLAELTVLANEDVEGWRRYLLGGKLRNRGEMR